MTMDNMTNLLGTVIVAGVAMKVADRMFPAPQQQRAAPARRRTTRRTTSRRPVRRTRAVQGHPGNFGNLMF